MTPELKQALMTIRDECRKHKQCDRKCPMYYPGSQEYYGYCRVIEGFVPAEQDPDEWEKENANDNQNDMA